MSILEQNPDATVSEALEGIPETLLSRRENLRMRAIMGAVPVEVLTDYTAEGLAAVLASAPDGRLADPTVRCEFTLPMSPKRIPAIAAFFLNYLQNGLPPIEEPAPAPTVTEPTYSRSAKERPRPPRRGVEVTLAELRADSHLREGGSLPARDSGSRKPRPAPRGRPVGTPRDLVRRRTE